jgi:hypothetical protein
MEPVSFDADSLNVLHGGFLNGSLASATDMTVDETGRLFGFNGLTHQLAEFDPGTLAVIHSTVLTGYLHGLTAHGGKLYAFTYSFQGVVSPISLDAYSFAPIQGSFVNGPSGVNSGLNMAIDETGRLFAYNPINHQLSEMDPDTLAVLHATALAGNLNGLAAHAGNIYAYSHGNPGLSPIALDANTFAVRTGTLLPEGLAPYPEVAVDHNTGRLFGFNPLKHELVELDPITLATLHSTPVIGALHGLAAFSIPEPATASLLSLVAAWALSQLGSRSSSMRRRQRSGVE